MKLIFVISLAFVVRTSKALVKCDGGLTKLKLCSLVEKYDKGVPLECKHCDPLEMRSSVTVFKIAELDEDQDTITLDLLLSVSWNDTRLTLETNDPNERVQSTVKSRVLTCLV